MSHTEQRHFNFSTWPTQLTCMQVQGWTVYGNERAETKAVLHVTRYPEMSPECQWSLFSMGGFEDMGKDVQVTDNHAKKGMAAVEVGRVSNSGVIQPRQVGCIAR